MHLTPREHERLLLAAAADLARRRLARGAPLGATEAVALVCDEICEMAWDGAELAEVVDRARRVVAPSALLPGVAGLVPVVEVEALFPWGSTLVHVDEPFGPAVAAGVAGPARVSGGGQDQGAAERVRLAPAAPDDPGARYRPGAVLPGNGDIELAAGAERRAAALRNTGPRDVWISSHFPLDQLNPAVRISQAGTGADGSPGSGDWAGTGGSPGSGDGAGTGAGAGPRAGAGWPAGWRLDLPAGEALLLRAGEEREVAVVATAIATAG